MNGREFSVELSRELAAAGIGPRLRRRIVTEFEDHLASDPQAQLGHPPDIARQFADELGTSLARRAAFQAFAALAVLGGLVVVRLLGMGAFHQIGGSTADRLGILAAVVAAQVSFVAGGLALVRGWRLRHQQTIPADEADILLRRAAVGLVAGAIAVVALPLRAAASPQGATGSSTLTIAVMAGAIGAVLLSLPALVRAVRLRPQVPGTAGDLLADFGPFEPLAARFASGSPTRFALITGAALFAVVSLAGVVANDPYDGMLRGLLEGGAYLTAYATLGRFLGLRR